MQEQMEVFRNPGQSKIILATNLAETSLTVPDCAVVVDSGLCKLLFFDQTQKCDCLRTVNIDRQNVVQRRGRTGRTMAGLYIACYSRDEFQEFAEQNPFEIQRVKPDQTVLQCV